MFLIQQAFQTNSLSEGGEKEMAYTPELSMKSSSTLRRIAWALGIPMTKTIEKVFEYLPEILEKKKVCEGCQDKTKCDGCAGLHPIRSVFSGALWPAYQLFSDAVLCSIVSVIRLKSI